MLMHLSPKERMAYAALGLIFLFAAGYVGERQIRRQDPVVVQELSPHRTSKTTTQTEPASPEPQPVTVHVAGAVIHPGLYKLPPGSRITDAIRSAGGFQTGVDQSQLNLAAKLIDGTQLYVSKDGSHGETEASYSGGATSSGSYGTTKESGSVHAAKSGKHPTGPISLSTASADQLESIPGIGPSTAERIVDYRKEHNGFKTVDELTAVGGIGTKKLAKMRKWLVP